MTIYTIGAFRMSGSIVAAGSTVTYPAEVEADLVARGLAVFDGPNPSVPDNRPMRMGLTNPQVIPEVIFDQGPDGRFLFTQYDGTYGQFLAQLAIAGGTSLAMTGKTALANTLPSGGLKNNAGTALGSGDIFGAWWLTSTRFLFAVRSIGAPFSTGCCFLYLCNWNGSAWTVGSNGPSLFDNKQAVRDIGTTGGASVVNNIVLHARSLAHNGAGKIMIGDYNVASGRVNGSTNDQVQVHWSTDYGVTWSKLLSWNTSGNQLRHVHSCLYDRYTGYWYILIGDAPTSTILRWDGTSASPPDNTALGNFKLYPGWEVLTGDWSYESGDLSINPGRIAFLPDDVGAVYGPTQLQSVALRTDKPLSVKLGRTFEWNRAQANPDRAPLICCNTPGGGSIWGSLFGSNDAVKGYDFWSMDDTLQADKIASAIDYGAASSGVLWNMFVPAGENRLVISGTDARGCRLKSNRCGSIVATLAAWDGKVLNLNPGA